MRTAVTYHVHWQFLDPGLANLDADSGEHDLVKMVSQGFTKKDDALHVYHVLKAALPDAVLTVEQHLQQLDPEVTEIEKCRCGEGYAAASDGLCDACYDRHNPK